MPEPKEEVKDYKELNLAQIIAELYRRRWIVGGITILAGILAVLYSLTIPNTYESSAALIIREPQSAITDTMPTPMLTVETLRALAESTDVKWTLFQQLWDQNSLSAWSEEGADQERAFQQFQQSLRTELLKQETRGSGGSVALLPLLVLRTSAPSPAEAQVIANDWANIVTTKSQTLYTQGVGDVNQFISELYQTADDKLMSGETELMQKTIDADLDLKKAQFDRTRNKVIQLEDEVFELRIDVLADEALIEDMEIRLQEREHDGIWLADWAEDVFMESSGEYVLDDVELSLEAKEILKRVKAIVEKEELLLAYETETGLDIKQNEAETLTVALGDANTQLSTQRLNLLQSLRERETVETSVEEQEIDNRWIGELLYEYYQETLSPGFEEQPGEAAPTKPATTPKTERIDRAVKGLVERELELLQFMQESDLEFKKMQLTLKETELDNAIREREEATKQLAITEKRLETLEPEMESLTEKITLDKAITDDPLWQQFLSGENSEMITQPLKTEVLNPVYQRVKNLAVDLAVESEALQSEIEYLNNRESPLRDEVEHLKEEVTLIAMDMKRREDAIAVQRDALEVLATQYKADRKRLEELIVENERMQQAIDALVEGRDEIYVRSRELQEEVARIELRMKAKRSDIDNLRKDLQDLEEDYREERSQRQILRLDLVRKQKELELKTELLTESTDESEALQIDIAKLEQDLNLQEREVTKLSGVRDSLATRAEEFALLTVTAENASRTGTGILYEAQANPLKVGPERKKIALAGVLGAFLLCSLAVCASLVIRQPQ